MTTRNILQEIAEAEAEFAGGICGLATMRDAMSTREFVDKTFDLYDRLIEVRLDSIMSSEDFREGGT